MKTGIIVFILIMMVVFATATVISIAASYARWCHYSFGEPTGLIIFMAPFILVISVVFGIVTEKMDK